MSSSPLIIAIDGPSASGKGTVAKKLAAHFDFALLDTGLLYRAVGLAVVTAGLDPADAKAAEHAALALGKFYLEAGDNGTSPPLTPPVKGGGHSGSSVTFDFAKITHDPALRSDAASVAASKVAAIPAVRAALLKFQKDFCQTPPNGKNGAVLDGRDIGTVIAPDAKVKIYVTASTEARAERRFEELQSRGENTTLAAVLQDMKERDQRDTERAVAPAKPADDAVILDTTTMNAEQAFAEAVKIAESKINS